MKSHEIAQMTKRLEEYEKLKKRLAVINVQLSQLDVTPVGFHDSPFTSNTRESRRIRDLDVRFTLTRGGEKEDRAHLTDLFIEGYALGQFLEQQLNAQKSKILEALEAL